MHSVILLKIVKCKKNNKLMQEKYWANTSKTMVKLEFAKLNHFM